MVRKTDETAKKALTSVVKILEFDNFSKTFNGREVVKNLSFTVQQGRIVGLLGKNGAGKSTSLRGALGLIQPTSGHARILGGSFAELGLQARRIGVSIEGVGQTPDATVARDLRVCTQLLGLPASRADDVLDVTGLDHARNLPVRKLSTGMRQRHSLAVAMLADPDVLILDEPTNGLDPEGIHWLRTFLRKRAEEGSTVLLSSHMLAEVEQTVDDVVILQQTLRYSGSLHDLTAGGRRRLEECFFELVPPTDASLPEAAKNA